MKKEKSGYSFVILTCVVLALMGFQMAGFQMTLTGAAEKFGIRQTGIGILVAVRGVSMIIAPLGFGMMADRRGKKPVLMISGTMMVLGALLAAWAPSVWLYGLGVFLMGAGSITNESVCSAAISDLFPLRSNQMLSLTQFFFNVGGVVGPLAIQFAMERFRVPWQSLYLLFGLAFALCLLPLGRAALPAPREETETEKRKNPLAFFRSPTYLLLFVGVIFYIGLDHTTGSFITTLFDSRLHAAQWGAGAVSVYWAGAALSRLLIGLRPMRRSLLMTGCFALSAAALLGMALSTNVLLSLAFCGLSSLAFGPLWSGFLSLAAGEFPRQSASAIGIMGTGSGIGAVVYPMLVGVMADTMSIGTAFLVLTAAAFLGTGLMVWYFRLAGTEQRM